MLPTPRRNAHIPPEFSLGDGLFGPVACAPEAGDGAGLSIAVLPFTTLGQGDGLLADAITEDLITDLSRISSVQVIGRSTMFTYKGTQSDARAVGRDLGVRYVVAGTLQATADRVAVNVELVDAASGIQQWADRIEQAEPDWVLAAGSISRRISRSLNLGLMEAGSRWPGHTLMSGTQAINLAMRGWVELFSKPQATESNRAAERWLHDALAIDSELALAWTGLAYATYRAASFGWGAYSFEEGCRQAVELAERAIALDSKATDAYYAMGQALNALDELERAHSAHETCIALNPSHAPAYAGLGQVRMFLGHPEETGDLCDRAFLLSPREPLRAVWHRSKGLAALFLGDAGAALNEAQAAVALNPAYPSAYVLLAAAAVRTRQLALASQAVAILIGVPRFQTIDEIRRYHARPRRKRFSSLLETMLADLSAAGMPLR